MKRSYMKRRPKKDKREPAEKLYMAWLRETYPNAEIHHARGLRFGCGMGMKAPDWFGFPLTQEMHDEYHRVGVETWESRHGSQQMHILSVWEKYGLDRIPEGIRLKLS